MPQPDYVPMTTADEVRQAERIPVPGHWFADRPAEVWLQGQPKGKRFGTPGPDQGYGFKLAERLLGRARLTAPEHPADALAWCVAVGLKRAARFGRAPVITDMELAFTLWGFLGDAPDDLVAFRKPMFLACSNDYWEQRKIADAVPDEALSLTVDQVRQRLPDWRTLFTTP